jgi:hypothetical protein
MKADRQEEKRGSDPQSFEAISEVADMRRRASRTSSATVWVEK